MMLAFQASVNDGTSPGTNPNPDILNLPQGVYWCCGFHIPSQNLVNAFKVDNDGLPLLDNFNDDDLDSLDLVDPRLDWTVGRINIPYLNWGVYNYDWAQGPELYGLFSPKKNAYYFGTDQRELAAGWQTPLYTSLNLHLIRYADVLLMLAECEVEVGDLNRARDLVNMIRMRAGNFVQGAGNDIESIQTTMDDPNITWANYKIGTYDDPWTDREYARKAVRFERRLELAMEGHRLFDLRRWGVAKEVLNEFIRVEQTKRSYLASAMDFEDKHQYFPLPEIQIKLSEIDGQPQLDQNPGYDP